MSKGAAPTTTYPASGCCPVCGLSLRRGIPIPVSLLSNPREADRHLKSEAVKHSPVCSGKWAELEVAGSAA